MDEYKPNEIEPRYQKLWEEAGIYKAIDFDNRQKKYILIEFPYPSGERLHVGHGRSYTALDAVSRKLRMQGFNVLYPLGWDAFGLPAENYAIKTGINPAITTSQNIANAKKQAKSWGLSVDWSREVNTTDPNYYKWTQWIFVQIYKKGLAYKAEIPVSWCPSCKINLANEEVIGSSCERCSSEVQRRTQSQWMLKITQYADRLLSDLAKVNYLPQIKTLQENWIGRSEGAEIQFSVVSDQLSEDGQSVSQSSDKPETDKLESENRQQKIENGIITVFTTRPDTLFGVTAMVLAPEHPLVSRLTTDEQNEAVNEYLEVARQKSEFERTEMIREKTGVFTGSYCINPINNEQIPIWIGDYVIGSYGGGAVMVVPAHDQRDFEFAKKYGLEIREVVKGGDVAQKAYEEEGIMVNSGKFDGLVSGEAKVKITDWLKERQKGGKTVSYKLRDWVFSRQHYWGEPIPIIYCRKCWELKSKNEKVKMREMVDYIVIDGQEYVVYPVPEEDLPVELPPLEKFQPSGTGESPLAAVSDWANTACPVCKGTARRETDTMPNWAGSNWYYLAYIMKDKISNFKFQISNSKHNDVFSENQKLLDSWMPVDLYNGGMEHTTLHLLYSRFIYKFLYDLGVVPDSEPYARRHSHGVVLGPDGARMSKSRGNVVNPDEVVAKWGADTFRLYEMFMGPFEQTIAWDEKGVAGCRRFLNRVFLLFQNNIAHKSTKETTIKLHQTIKKVTEDLDNLKFNTAIAAMMEFTNVWSGMKLNKEEALMFLKILAPFAPHISEALYQQRTLTLINADQEADERGSEFVSIHQQEWPEFDPNLIQEEMVEIVIQVNGKVRDIMKIENLTLRFHSGQESKMKSEIGAKARVSEKMKLALKNKKIKKVIFVPGKLINFVTQ